MALIRFDLSPLDYIHVPQAPRIERPEISRRGVDNEWQMWGVTGVGKNGEPLGVSNHTWSHLDAPYHLLPDGLTFERLDPRQYLALDARVVDLTRTTPERRETIDGVSYHSRIDVDDLPASLDDCEAVLFVTGFAALYGSGYPMRPHADEHYPHVTRAAAERLAAATGLQVVGIDGPSVDKPQTNAAAHRVLLGRSPSPVLLLETLTFERMRGHVSVLPQRVLLTIEPFRAFGRGGQDGALSSVFAYAPEPGAETAFASFSAAMRGARLVV
jgi:kynurenine formamidase